MDTATAHDTSSGARRDTTSRARGFVPAERGRIPLAEIDRLIGLTPRVERMRERYFEVRPAVCGERARFMMESYLETEGQHPAKRRAKAFANVLAKMTITIREDELLVGSPTRFLRGALPNVELAPLNLLWLLNQHEAPTTASEVNETHLEPEDKEWLLEACHYWKDKYAAKRAEEIITELDGGKWKQVGEARMGMCQPYTPMLFTPGADYDKILAIGMNGFIKEAQDHIDRLRTGANGAGLGEKDHEKVEWLESVIIVLEAMIAHAHRYAALAREMAAAERDPARKRDLETIADVCEWAPANPARGFHDALQTYWFVAVGHDIEKANPNAFIGRFDQYMWPYYSRDINSGRLTRDQAAELMGCLFMKWTILEPFLFMGLLGKRYHQEISPANYFANMTLGGQGRDGRDAANELTCLILQVAKQVKTHQPHISIRYHRAMAPELLQKGIECNRDHGAGIPAWFNDRLGTEYLLDRGVQWDDARDWAMAGCINTSYPKSFAWTRNAVVSFVNHAKLVEITLNNGVDPYTGHKLGIETGDPRTFTSWEQLVDAYKQQIDAFYDYCVANFRAMEKVYYQDSNYFPFISAFLQDCIGRGKDATRGGGRYQQLEAWCFVDRAQQDACDALMGIKKVVFEDKKATMDELITALKADWQGYEELRQACLAAPKYGNDEDEPDEFLRAMWRYTVDKCQSYRDGFGRRFTMFRQGAAWSTWAGKSTGALPNGRKSGTSLADASASPQQGCDVKGPTASMNSVSKLDNMFVEGPLLNMKFAPGMLKKKEGMHKFAELMGTYFDRGGFHVQFNILDRETLLEAKKNPEKYRNLVVRVAGYSAFWVELTPAVQDEIISRTEQRL
ncbi:MAG: pyruvate formate lyase family protein [Candidatus Binatia bacterium]